MANGPHGGPWQVIASGPTSDKPTIEKIFDQFRTLYRAAALHGISAAALDACEIWQVGAMLRDTEGRSGNGSGVSSTKRNLIAERFAASQGLAPEPQPDEPSPEVETFMTQAQSLRRN